MLRALSGFACCLLSAALSAATADDLLARIPEMVPPEELVPGSMARARAIADLITANAALDAGEMAILRIAYAEALLDAGDSGEARAALHAAGLTAQSPPAARLRAGQFLVASYRSDVRTATAATAVPDVAAVLAAAGYADLPQVRALSLACDAERLLIDVEKARIDAIMNRKPIPAASATVSAAVLGRIDSALALLANADPDERTPIIGLRIDAMERLHTPVVQAKAWMERIRSDPAATILLDHMLTGGDRLIGATAPALAGPRHDKPAEHVDIAAMRGKPALVVFFASWSNASENTMLALRQIVAAYGQEVAYLGVALERQETMEKLGPYLARVGIEFPVIADGLGWDGERDEIWMVRDIPEVYLVDAHGLLVKRGLAERSVAETDAAIRAALAELGIAAPKAR